MISTKSMTIIDGKKISGDILEGIKKEVTALSFVPLFCDVLVGNDPSSVQYVEMKKRRAESVGMKFYPANFPVTITTEELIQEIQKINQVENMCGVIVQLPLPAHIDRKLVLEAIDLRLDVDGLGSQAGMMMCPTALACIALLDSLNMDLVGKNIVVLGQGDLVGKPVTALLRASGLYPVVVDTSVVNKAEIIKNADIIISGIGHGKFLTGDMLKPGVVLIDAGTSESSGAIVGDVDLDSVKDVASFVSPVPGGVGPVTVAMLFKNVLNVAKKVLSK